MNVRKAMAFTVFIYGVRWCVTILYRSTVAVEWLAKPSPLKQYGVLPPIFLWIKSIFGHPTLALV